MFLEILIENLNYVLEKGNKKNYKKPFELKTTTGVTANHCITWYLDHNLHDDGAWSSSSVKQCKNALIKVAKFFIEEANEREMKLLKGNPPDPASNDWLVYTQERHALIANLEERGKKTLLELERKAGFNEKSYSSSMSSLEKRLTAIQWAPKDGSAEKSAGVMTNWINAKK
jgi:hypothetical protein